ncbi:Ammonium transporter 1 member 2 [Holothuria leucospilota]|uniref:Ammonium transporter n=1 Tax=Holothuria leucospilota TaxID=206669 RepID=A0A9Q1BGD5_HOLLE|nr:Ammonium transporter 1 member 2 [Holothuria leucospilota]
MQFGFAFLEAGSVRAKNTTNILIKNILDLYVGALCYWMFGYAFAFGKPGNGFIGAGYFFFSNIPGESLSTFFFHWVFAATATTIVSGAVAERTEFISYLFYSVGLTGIIYPIVSHWAWSDEGWLANGPNVSYRDFAGSGVVHMVGGTAALVGAAILGPRIGRFDENGKPQIIQGHTVPLVALGGFILLFGFFAFNGGSQASVSQPGDAFIISNAVVNTILSGASAALVSLSVSRTGFGSGKWSLLTTINGGLAGMVAICAGCDAEFAWGAVVTGILAGFVYHLTTQLVEYARVDDPLDAVAVHLGGGVVGVLTAPFLIYPEGIVFNWDGPSFLIFGWNIVGGITIFLWTAALSTLLFGGLQLTGFLRVSEEIELKGLDIPKHGEPAYPPISYHVGWQSDLYNLPPDDSPGAKGVGKFIFSSYTYTLCQASSHSRY